jgi:hypothetical protein
MVYTRVMAARTSKTVLHEKWREKIQGSMILNRLCDHVLGECEMSPTQVRAAEILLRKVLPDLSAVDHSGSVEQVYSFAVPIGQSDTRSAEEWAQQTVQ